MFLPWLKKSLIMRLIADTSLLPSIIHESQQGVLFSECLG